MKKILLSIVLLTTLTFSLSAYSWYGQLDAGISVLGPQNVLDLEQADKVTLGFRVPFNTSILMDLEAEGFYEFKYKVATTGEKKSEISHLADLTTFTFGVQVPIDETFSLSLDTGRFSVADVTSIIISQPVDGAKVIFSHENFQLNAYVGFTGLLNAYNVSINAAANKTILSDVYTLAAPFIVAEFMFSMPQLFANQNLYAEFLAAVDVGAETNKNSKLYATAALQGPINSSLFYFASSSLGIEQVSKDWNISNMSVFELSTFLPFASSLVSWKTVFATGGTDTMFNTFTVASASMDDSLMYAGHVKTGVVATFRPIDKLLFFLGPDVLFNVMNETSGKGYAGFQWLFSGRWDATSDVQLVATVGQFLPRDSSIDPYLKADLKLSLKF